MEISKGKVESILKCLKEGLLHLDKGNSNTARLRFGNALNILESKLAGACPECGSNDVLDGSNNKPSYCVDCKYEWNVTSESVIKISNPSKLLTINRKLSRSSFDSKLDEALDKI